MALTKGQKIAIGVSIGIVAIGGTVLAIKWKDWFGNKKITPPPSGSGQTPPPSGSGQTPPSATTQKQKFWDKAGNILNLGQDAVKIAEGVGKLFNKDSSSAEGFDGDTPIEMQVINKMMNN
ncbi:MAG: hypothetical protein KBG30_01585 [Bacteroidales bacterium]|nr:hypothetical protein [Bacteroidales bacterium]